MVVSDGYEHTVKLIAVFHGSSNHFNEWEAEDEICDVLDKVLMEDDDFEDFDYADISHIEAGCCYDIIAKVLCIVKVVAHSYEKAYEWAEKAIEGIRLPKNIKLDSVEAVDYEWVKEPCLQIVGD